MSTVNRTPDKKEVSEISISEHAVLRYRQRVDPSEPMVRDKIREIFEKGRKTRLRGFVDPAKIYEGVALVFNAGDEEIVTVLKPRGEQLIDTHTEPDASAGWEQEYRHQEVSPGGHR